MYVLKIGGNELDQPDFLAALATAIGALPGPGVVVHGGGKEIGMALQRQGIVPEMRDGLRVTTPAVLAVVEQVLSATINKRLVRLLNAAGVPAIGVSGVDLDLIQATPSASTELGLVGEITAVRGTVLQSLQSHGWLPVVSPVSVDCRDHTPLNVNADHAALAIAAALAADELIFVSNVPGVLRDGVVLPRLTPTEVEAAITAGVITGGMIPKVRSAVAALAQVRAVRITRLADLAHGGTQITNDL